MKVWRWRKFFVERSEEMNIKSIPTNELVAELKTRDGVETHTIGPSASIEVTADGPAIVFVVID